MDILAGEEATSDHHSAGGCKVDASLAIVIGDGVRAVIYFKFSYFNVFF